jgi:hypothetical protein
VGLSLYYRYKVKTDTAGARGLVERLHRFVKKLPFDAVTDVEEYDSPDGHYVFEQGELPLLLRGGDRYLSRKRADGETDHVHVPALHVVCFHASVEGSETASFGLASHPPVVVHNEDVVTYDADGNRTTHVGAGEPIEFPTRLRGWYSWQHSVKTQYAADPRHGGPTNFLKAHVSIFRAIDEAKRLGMNTRIRDDTSFWRDRDEAKLLAELARWDALIAGFAGKIGDKLAEAGHNLEAPIKDRSDYEHLEAKGAQMMNEAGRKPGRKRRRGGGAGRGSR